MKAICVGEFGDPEVLKLVAVPDPRPPESGEVLVRVKAAGMNPYDTHMRSGAYGSANPALPFTPGSDASGVVESVGTDSDLTHGQRVGCVAGALEETEYRRQLVSAGFPEIEVEPTRTYCVEAAREFLSQKGLDVNALASQADGKFMSAFVRASKPKIGAALEACHSGQG